MAPCQSITNQCRVPVPTDSTAKSAHYVSMYPLSNLAGAAKVHNPDRTSLGVAEEDVLWFEVAVDDLDFRSGQEQQSSAQLLGKLSCQVQRDATKIGVPQQLIEVVGEQFKHQAKVIPIHKVPLHPNYRGIDVRDLPLALGR